MPEPPSTPPMRTPPRPVSPSPDPRVVIPSSPPREVTHLQPTVPQTPTVPKRTIVRTPVPAPRRKLVVNVDSSGEAHTPAVVASPVIVSAGGASPTAEGLPVPECPPSPAVLSRNIRKRKLSPLSILKRRMRTRRAPQKYVPQ